MEAEWLAVLPGLREDVGERNFATWIEPIHCAKEDGGLRLEVPSRFHLEWLTRHFLAQIRSALEHAHGTSVHVRVVVGSGVTSVGTATEALELGRTPRRRAPRIGRLVGEYVFATFVVGSSNEVAYQAARSVVDTPGRRFNPFFVWGGVGLGKTHLINALAHEMLARSQRCRVACISAETFMNTLITSLRQDQMNAFRDRFRDLDALILDDVQFLAGKERTQEEFFHTFEALLTAGRQVVLTSDKPPHAIAGLEQRLRSRFEGGLMADVRPPTHEMRLTIVTQKAKLQGFELGTDIAHVIAVRSGPSVRELEGALTRVLATSALAGVPITVGMVEQLLAPVVPPRAILCVETIQEQVAERLGVSVEDLRSHRRERGISYARQIAMYLSRTLADASLNAIAEKFGGRDHTTVMYAVRVLEERRVQDFETRTLLGELERLLQSR